jgi:Tol biopolymer transport system component
MLKISFYSTRDGNTEIYIMNVDGSEQINLTNSPANDGNPSFSPDDSKIVFISDRGGNGRYDICLMNTGGSDQVKLTDYQEDEHFPCFSICKNHKKV